MILTTLAVAAEPCAHTLIIKGRVCAECGALEDSDRWQCVFAGRGFSGPMDNSQPPQHVYVCRCGAQDQLVDIRRCLECEQEVTRD